MKHGCIFWAGLFALIAGVVGKMTEPAPTPNGADIAIWGGAGLLVYALLLLRGTDCKVPKHQVVLHPIYRYRRGCRGRILDVLNEEKPAPPED